MSTSVTLPITGPWATAGFTQAYWSTMVSYWQTNGGVHGDPVIPGKLQAYGDSSGMQIKVRAGSATWLGQYAELSTEAIIDIAANASGNPRIDRVVLRRDPTAHTQILTRIAGTPGVTPAAPALTAQDMPICQVAVANAAVTIAAANVTDERRYFPIGVIPTSGTATYPTSPMQGQMIVDSGNGVYVPRFWNAGAWQSLMVGDDTGWSTVASRGVGWSSFAGSPTQIRKIGDLVELRGRLTKGAAATNLMMTLAGSFAPTYGTYSLPTLSTGGAIGGLNINTDGTVVLSNPAPAAIANGDYVNVWANWRTS